MENEPIPSRDRTYLRDLAKKQLEIARKPIMTERKRLWYDHNALRGERPVIAMEPRTIQELIPPARCQFPAAVAMEKALLTAIMDHELINDDKVVPDYYAVNWRLDQQLFGLETEIKRAKDTKGRELGFATVEYPIHDLKEDFHKLQASSRPMLDREGTLAEKRLAEDVFGDILPVVLETRVLRWYNTPTAKIIGIMGMEQFMFALMDYPDEVRAFLQRLEEAMIDFYRFLEEEEVLTLNNVNHYAGAGSYGFTDELPSPEYKRMGKVMTKDLWGNLNSQETVGLSPDMFKEFIYPIHKKLASEFGLVYYGCCESVHGCWDDCLENLPNLRKVSISPWCDELFMGERLKNSNVIYSRKPSPNFIGVGDFDQSAYRAHITRTLKAAQGCKLEIIIRDIYTVNDDVQRPGKAIQLIRELIDEHWS